MIEDFVAKACASCDKQFKPKAAKHKMCDGCFSMRDKKAPKLSSADTSVTMTPATQESFKQHRKFKAVNKNAKRWSSKKNGASSFSVPSSKKGKSGAVHMITSLNDEGSTEHTSKKARLASSDIENADQSTDDESDDDLQLTGAASSSMQGGVTSRGEQDDKTDPRDSTKTGLKARGPQYGPVLRPEGSSDLYNSHLCCEYEYTGPFKKTSEPASETRPPPVITRRCLARTWPGAGKELATSSDNKGSTERPAKKPRTVSSASVMHVQPLCSDDDDGHNLLLSTATGGGHGVFMAEAEVDKIEDWYESDND
jgi:hypothetical protein